MVQRQRRGDVSLLGEHDQPDPVVGPLVDEIAQDGLGHVEAVDALAAHHEILGDHAAGEVQRGHDVNAAGLHLRGALQEPGLGQRHEAQPQRQPAQGGQKGSGPGPPRPRQPGH